MAWLWPSPSKQPVTLKQQSEAGADSSTMITPSMAVDLLSSNRTPIAISMEGVASSSGTISLTPSAADSASGGIGRGDRARVTRSSVRGQVVEASRAIMDAIAESRKGEEVIEDRESVNDTFTDGLRSGATTDELIENGGGSDSSKNFDGSRLQEIEALRDALSPFEKDLADLRQELGEEENRHVVSADVGTINCEADEKSGTQGTFVTLKLACEQRDLDVKWAGIQEQGVGRSCEGADSGVFRCFVVSYRCHFQVWFCAVASTMLTPFLGVFSLMLNRSCSCLRATSLTAIFGAAPTIETERRHKSHGLEKFRIHLCVLVSLMHADAAAWPKAQKAKLQHDLQRLRMISDQLRSLPKQISEEERTNDSSGSVHQVVSQCAHVWYGAEILWAFS